LRFGLSVANFGSYADPHAAVHLARTARDAGWDGYFVWDHLAFVWNGPAADPWVTLAAIASQVEGLTLGTFVTPLARRRPQVVASTLQTLSRLNEHVVFGAGLGGNEREFTEFGESFDAKERAERLDAGLEVVRSLWDGPIWIGGNAPAPLRRASRFDGWAANSSYLDHMTLTPEEVASRVKTIRAERGTLDGFDVVVQGLSDLASPRDYAAAGATWWLENAVDRREDADAALRRVAAGPPS